MKEKKADVVIVPDFTGTNARFFELSTLFFLGSWIEQNSHNSSSVLHIVSIGEVPASVRWLAEKAHALLSVHRAVGRGGFYNKVRGFEVVPQTEHLLLLDTDIIFFRSISEIVSQLDFESISASVANDAHLSIHQWERLYAAVGVDLPLERISTVNGQFNGRINTNINFEEYRATFPYFNGGVLSFPWASDIGNEWTRAIHEIDDIIGQNFFQGESIEQRVFVSNQHSLAIAIERLKRKGRKFSRLSDTLHARWQHLYLGSFPRKDILLFHTIGAFKSRESHNLELTVHDEFSLYDKRIFNRFMTVFRMEQAVRGNFLSKLCYWIKLIRPIWYYYYLRSTMMKIYNRHVRIALYK